MMKAVAAVSTVLCLGLGSCSFPPSPPGIGFVYTDVKGPLATNPGPMGTKVGMAESQAILGIVAQGDSSIDTAAKNGSINEVTHVDFKSWTILGIVSRFTTIVHGN